MEDRRIRPAPVRVDPATTGAARVGPARFGVYGKLPARGDFVRLGLPGSFVTPWDDWLAAVIAGSRAAMAEDWLPAWLKAPVWRFVLAAGSCGPEAVLGLMLPSVDRVGRYFPLTLAAVFAVGWTASADAWLDAAEALGRAALEQDMTPEQIVQSLPAPAVGAVAAASGAWWTEGGPLVPPQRLALSGLPDAARFAAMIGAATVAADAATEIGA